MSNDHDPTTFDDDWVCNWCERTLPLSEPGTWSACASCVELLRNHGLSDDKIFHPIFARLGQKGSSN